jgi:cytochrome c
MNIRKILVSSIALASLISAGATTAQDGGDSAHGEELFKTYCSACHNTTKGATPDMYGVVLPLRGIVGKEAAQTKGFFYSKAMRESAVVWTEENLDQYLEDPKKMIPEIRMEFVGMENQQDRLDLIAFILSTQQDDTE